jgi:dihydroxy-acid dehydratase
VRSGEVVIAQLDAGITARRILTKTAFENAIAVVMALGGSTNAVLHLLAIAHEARVDLTLDDFNRVGDRTPHLADVRPFGRYVMSDVDRIGGVPVVMKALLDAGVLDGDALTVTGRTLGEELSSIAPPDPDGKIIHGLSEPIHRTGGLTILRGSLAPEGAVVKSASFESTGAGWRRPRLRRREGCDGCRHRGPDLARGRGRHPVRRAGGRSRDARDARGHGGDQGRRPRQRRAAAHRRAVLRRDHGPCIGTWRRRRPTAGPIALVQDGDRIRLDMTARTLDLLVDAAELERRRAGWKLHRPATRPAPWRSTPSSSGPRLRAPSAAEPVLGTSGRWRVARWRGLWLVRCWYGRSAAAGIVPRSVPGPVLTGRVGGGWHGRAVGGWSGAGTAGRAVARSRGRGWSGAGRRSAAAGTVARSVAVRC